MKMNFNLYARIDWNIWNISNETYHESWKMRYKRTRTSSTHRNAISYTLLFPRIFYNTMRWDNFKYPSLFQMSFIQANRNLVVG